MAEQSPAVLIDANLLLWAHHGRFNDHEAARDWLAKTMSRTPVVGIPWPTTLAFCRISTHPRVFERPMTIAQAWEIASGWLARPNVTTPVATDRHAEILGRLLVETPAPANHSTDAHLAALAIEWGLELMTADGDFARYEGLRWRNPLR